MAQTDTKLTSVAALLAAAWLFALAPTTARAAGSEEVAVGGYLDTAPAVGGAALSDGGAPPLAASLGRLAIIDSDGGRSRTLTYFTPRLSGFQLGLGYTPEAFSLREPTMPPGRVPGTEGGEGGGDRLAVGGGLSLSALELGLPPSVQSGRGDAGLVTAEVGYGFGPVSTSLTYGFAKPAADEELNLFALSADLAVVPGVAVTGGVAYAEEEKTGDQTAAGMLGVRLNF